MVFCPKHPRRDQNLKFTPLSETTSIPAPFIWESPPPQGGDYIKPNLELSPDQVILHVGTNDLKQKEPQQVADSIVDLARQVENSSEASITMSELVPRRDKFNEAVTTTNVHFKSYCRQNGWELIQHRNISEKGLNQGGLHLNVKGNQIF